MASRSAIQSHLHYKNLGFLGSLRSLGMTYVGLNCDVLAMARSYETPNAYPCQRQGRRTMGLRQR